VGFLDVFKKKKDEFNTNPDMGMPLQGSDQQPTHDSAYSPFDQGNGFQQDPYSAPSQGYSNYPEPGAPAAQQQYPPDQYTFERTSPSQSSGFPRGSTPSQSVNDINTNKEFELINAKLDAIKSELDSVNQRLKRMERISEGSGTPGKHDAWY